MIAVSERICRCASVPSSCTVIRDTRARECLSAPTPKGGFSLGLPGADHSFDKRLSLDDPRPQEGQVLRPGSPGHPWGQAVPGRDRAGGITGKPPLGYCVTFETAPPGATPGRRTECSAAGLG